jgi:hypothetical protein
MSFFACGSGKSGVRSNIVVKKNGLKSIHMIIYSIGIHDNDAAQPTHNYNMHK